MKLTHNHYAFVVSALCGFLVWYFSRQITGESEPWDGNFLVYFACLVTIGFVCVYLFKSSLKSVYWGRYLGQVLVGGIPFFGCIALGVFCEGGANLFPLGAVFLLAYSLPLLLGGVAASQAFQRQNT